MNSSHHYLQPLRLEVEPVERLDGPCRVRLVRVLDEAEAEADSGRAVAANLRLLHGADAAEQRRQLVFSHRRRDVVDDQVARVVRPFVRHRVLVRCRHVAPLISPTRRLTPPPLHSAVIAIGNETEQKFKNSKT